MRKLDNINWRDITEKAEEKLVSDGSLAFFFEDIENLYPMLEIIHNSNDKTFAVKMKIETDGTPVVPDEIQEQINDHIMDRYLTPEMEIAGIDGEDLGDLAWEVTVELLPLQD